MLDSLIDIAAPLALICLMILTAGLTARVAVQFAERAGFVLFDVPSSNVIGTQAGMISGLVFGVLIFWFGMGTFYAVAICFGTAFVWVIFRLFLLKLARPATVIPVLDRKSPGVPNVFVSHSSTDSKVALSICAALEKQGLSCWVASRDVQPGQNFQESIVRAIRVAKVMVLVFSSNANTSEEIKKELVLASQNKVAIIPVRVEDVVPNEALAYEFATRQWVDLFSDWERETQRLGAWVTSVLQPGNHAQPTPASKLI